MESNENEIPVKKSGLKNLLKFILVIVLLIAIGLLGFGMLYKERVNILLMGVEGTRTDTIIFMSIDTKNNTVDAISIPRDTYYPTDGKNGLGQKKINAVYGFKENGGSEGVVKTISNLLGVKIDYYVNLDYDGVAELVDLVGGVEVDVPFRMKYDDPYATPELHIDFQPGVQKISGKDAMAYLRFRKSNDGTIREGDVQRIDRQQAFLLSASKSIIQPKLPYIAAKGISYVKTNMPMNKAIIIGTSLIGLKSENIKFQTLPVKSIGNGKDGLSYFFHDDAATKQLLIDIVNQ